MNKKRLIIKAKPLNNEPNISEMNDNHNNVIIESLMSLSQQTIDCLDMTEDTNIVNESNDRVVDQHLSQMAIDMNEDNQSYDDTIDDNYCNFSPQSTDTEECDDIIEVKSTPKQECVPIDKEREIKDKSLINSNGKYVCDYIGCGREIKTLKSLKKHKLIIHFNESLKRYTCQHEGCSKEFLSETNLKRHEEIHSIPTLNCLWKGCSAVFSVKRNLERHMVQHKELFRCTHENCQFNGITKMDLENHLSYSHSKNKQFKCEINDCNQFFTQEIALKRHRLRAHPNEFDDIPWIHCTQTDCNYKTKWKSDYNQHKNRHNSSYVCDECQKQFSSIVYLKKHKTIHFSELRIQCEWYECERTFRTKDLMKDHMNTHTLENTYSCVWPGCDKTYITKKSLNVHQQRHKGTGLYSCSQCSFMTTNPIRFNSHKKKHSTNS